MEFVSGVVVVDGLPRVLVTADYPYYRDDPVVWADRLRAVRDELGIQVITSYVPWRHHQPAPDRPPAFGDVLDYLELCDSLGLTVIAKPGPFVHAELDYGGLPDWVDPASDPDIEPLLDSHGDPSRWMGRALPAPLGSAFLGKVTQWLSAVGKELGGAVAGWQIANEGVYTSGALPLTAYDYSPSGLALFRSLLVSWYGTPESYNRVHGSRYVSWDEVPPSGPDWGRFHASYLATVYRTWADALGTSLPVVVNLNPPTIAELDDWLARVRPAGWDGITYGFTNWMGVVSADPAAQARYVIAAKRAPGPNLEENWGFATLYDAAYADGATSFHQTLLALAAGATGFNVYTGVATSTWSPSLDSMHAPPYPDRAPIGLDGLPTAKALVVRALAGFFSVHGAEFLACEPACSAVFGLYAPLATEGRLGEVLLDFHARMRSLGCDYTLVDLETSPALDGLPVVIVPPGLPEPVRAALPPGARELDGALTLSDICQPTVVVTRGHADAYWRAHPSAPVAYLTVLVQDSNTGPITVSTPLGDVELVCARGGAAVVRLVNGYLDDVIVKGTNAHLDSFETASITFANERLTSTGPADLIITHAPF
ncbi:beta-galactosidase [Nonomuraea sp. NPDC050536]|uniref:beta-galactosidase n=1 Tax=Nonomuraea sp. NPDC050536 TaxID=3364366 RepID=UPI0037C9721F